MLYNSSLYPELIHRLLFIKKKYSCHRIVDDTAGHCYKFRIVSTRDYDIYIQISAFVCKLLKKVAKFTSLQKKFPKTNSVKPTKPVENKRRNQTSTFYNKLNKKYSEFIKLRHNLPLLSIT